MAGGGAVIAGELSAGGLARGVTLRLPRSAGGEIPLVLALHGNQPDAGGWTMREWTSFDERADAGGFAVAYPHGCGGCWADGRGVTTADEAGVDDVAFLRAVIDWSAARHGTVPDRAVVAGISNGAFMAHRLALEASDQVAVLAAVAGGLPASLRDARPAHAVSAMLIHGTDDAISPISGGYSRHRGPHGELRGRTLSLDETAGLLARHRPLPAWAGGDTRHRVLQPDYLSQWRGRNAGRVLDRVRRRSCLAGLAWARAGATHEFDAAEEIWRFAAPLLVPAASRRLCSAPVPPARAATF